MQKLELNFEKLKEDVVIKPLNLMLVFQVNCPGCFSHALPLFNELATEEEFSDVSFFALSTAFEDFELNTAENTLALLEHGTLVGETKKYMAKQGADVLPYHFSFPVAMDEKVEEIPDMEKAIEHICGLNAEVKDWPEIEQRDLIRRVREFLTDLDEVSLTFTLNQFKGTPTFVLFDDEMNVINGWFGHQHIQALRTEIHNQLAK